MKKLLRRSVNAIPLRARSWIRHIPGVAASQRLLIRTALAGEPFLHTINAGAACGLRIELMLPEDKAIWAGTFESEFATAVANSVRPGDVCYDVGGYCGYMSGVLALAGASRVVVFEPLPRNVARLTRLAELNPKLPLDVHATALGNFDGTSTLLVMQDQSMGKLHTSRFQQNADFVEEIRVAIGKVDTLVFDRGCPAPNLLKIDVEGAETDVLDGAVRALTEYRPVICLEAHSSSLAKSCIDRLANLKYAVSQIEQRDLASTEARHLILRPH